MCGIVGWITLSKTAKSWDRKRYIDQALILDTIRGDDSTGVFAVDHKPDKARKGQPHYAKLLGDGYSFVTSQNYYDLLGSAEIKNYRAVIGHNRAATQGGVNIKTAHPFQEGPITLVHNGTLRHTNLLPKSEYELKAENDSHTIAHNLALQGPKLSDIEDLIYKTHLSGAFALIWHDSRDDSINIVRNNERPLHLSKAKNDSTIYIASEAEMLNWLDKRIDLGLGTIVQPKSGMLFKFLPKDLTPKTRQINLTYHNTNSTKWKKESKTKITDKRSITSKTPPKTKVFEKDNKWVNDSEFTIFVGGRNRSVPMLLQEQLIDADMCPEEPLEFIPLLAYCIDYEDSRAQPKSYMVRGTIKTDHELLNGMQAELHGVTELVWKNAAQRVWTFNPIGIKVLAPFKVCVVGKFKAASNLQGSLEDSFKYKGKSETFIDRSSATTNTETSANNPDDGPNDLVAPDDYVKGRKGLYIQINEFLKEVESGCIMCGAPISPADAEDIVWVNEGQQDAMCKSCVDETVKRCENE